MRRPNGDPIVPPRRAWDVAEEAYEMLVDAVRPSPGLDADEVDRVEQRFGFRFAPVHRAFLSLGLPRGPQWPNWRSGSIRDLSARMGAPAEGVVADVLEHDFWPTRWGMRPFDLAEREAVARAELARVPALVPVFADCYLPAADTRAHCPVLSVERSLVTVVANDLLHYVQRVFWSYGEAPADRPLRVPFWSELAELFDPERHGPGIMEP